jgi:ferredoxin
MAMSIDPDSRTACGDCKPACPTKSVLLRKGVFSIDERTCDECDGDPKCVSVCGIDCIQQL